MGEWVAIQKDRTLVGDREEPGTSVKFECRRINSWEWFRRSFKDGQLGWIKLAGLFRYLSRHH